MNSLQERLRHFARTERLARTLVTDAVDRIDALERALKRERALLIRLSNGGVAEADLGVDLADEVLGDHALLNKKDQG